MAEGYQRTDIRGRVPKRGFGTNRQALFLAPVVEEWKSGGVRRLERCPGNMYSIAVHVEGAASMANRTSYTKARATLASLCDRVAETREPYVIERRNGENVALISEAELNSLLETAHLLRSPRNASRLASSLERALGGKRAPSSLEQLRQSLGLEDT
jgi:antitoxin YefM